MRRILFLLIVAAAMLLSSCAPAVTDPTGDPGTTDSQSAVSDTQPAEEDPAWLVKYEEEQLSYKEYFSKPREFTSGIPNQWEICQCQNATGSDEKYALCLDELGFFVVKFCGEDQPTVLRGNRALDKTEFVWNSGHEPFPVVWDVPDSQKLWKQIDVYLSDGAYAYCVRNQNEIISVDLYTGEVKTLVSGVSIPVAHEDCIGLYDRTLLYITQHEDKIHINRLYLPEMINDVLYTDISVDAFVCDFQLGYPASDTLYWRIFNEDRISRVLEVLADPNSDYRRYIPKPDELWGKTDIAAVAAHESFMTLAQMIELIEEKPAMLDCYYYISQDSVTENVRWWSPQE